MTALRFSADKYSKETLEDRLLDNLDPQSLGFRFRPVREQAMAASGQSIDFGQLFLGLSFFLMLAALILAALLFVLGIEQRTTEIGTLRAIGYSTKSVRSILMIEGMILSSIGAIIGVLGGILYNLLTLQALATFWIGAIGTKHLLVHTTFSSLCIGGFAGWVTALAAMWITLRGQATKTIRDLQQSTALLQTSKKAWQLPIGLILIIAAVIIVFLIHPAQDRNAAGAFWGAGSMMLLGSLLLTHYRFNRILHDRGLWQIDIVKLGRRATARRSSRSTAAVALLALGVFIVVAVGANRRSTLKNAEDRASGTGGFALYVETTLPVRENILEISGRSSLGLEIKRDDDIQFVPIRLRKGADASCLNLNRIMQPKVMGIYPEGFEERGSFTFAATVPELSGDDIWKALNEDTGDVIPAIADQGVIVWGLQMSIGDTLLYTGDSGETIKLRLIGGLVSSVFQGAVLISQHHFTRAFPSVTGTNVILIDAPQEKTEATQKLLSRTMANLGVKIETTSGRLAGFLVIENTYLSIFLALGGLALVVGTMGLGVLIFRNVMERRSELALLRAVGYDEIIIRRMLIAENLSIFISGTFIGTVSAILAVMPALMAPGTQIPYTYLVITLLVIITTGLIWIISAARLALKGNLMPALRNE